MSLHYPDHWSPASEPPMSHVHMELREVEGVIILTCHRMWVLPLSISIYLIDNINSKIHNTMYVALLPPIWRSVHWAPPKEGKSPLGGYSAIFLF